MMPYFFDKSALLKPCGLKTKHTIQCIVDGIQNDSIKASRCKVNFQDAESLRKFLVTFLPRHPYRLNIRRKVKTEGVITIHDLLRKRRITIVARIKREPLTQLRKCSLKRATQQKPRKIVTSARDCTHTRAEKTKNMCVASAQKHQMRIPDFSMLMWMERQCKLA